MVLLAAGDWTAVLVAVPPTHFHFYFLNLFYFLSEATPSLFIRVIVTALESHLGRQTSSQAWVLGDSACNPCGCVTDGCPTLS